MNIKLVCMDLDGTINDNWDLFPPLRTKMEELKNKGVIFTIITGRDPLGTLFYVYNCKFPFKYLGTGGGGIIIDPFDNKATEDLFKSPITIQSIKNCGFSKGERLAYVQSLVGAKDEETLYCEDNANNSASIEDIRKNVHCNIASPATNNIEWLRFVEERNGFITDLPCGRGTLIILKHYFGE